MKPLIVVAILLCLLGEARANQGLEVTVSKPYAETALPGRVILGLSWFNGRLTPFPGYAEYGITAMPPWGGSTSEDSPGVRAEHFVGMYGGHLFVPFRGLVRPGFQIGWVWEETKSKGEASASKTHRQFSFYYAFKVQVSCLTFLASSKGIGGGVNFSL